MLNKILNVLRAEIISSVAGAKGTNFNSLIMVIIL